MSNKAQYDVNGDEFIIRDYNNSKAFASFLPAISGLWGKPLWVYYVNRGQAISNFGVRDKDGAMIEFSAANKAWRQTSLQGFRTFYKINGIPYEPFRNTRDRNPDSVSQTMYIKAHSVRLVDRNEELGVETEAVFCTLPNENFPALLRRLTIKNIAPNDCEIECIDGLPMLTPWGTRNWMLKNLSRLGEGWFGGVKFTKGGIPYYKLSVEALDRPEIVPLKEAHFYCGIVREYRKKGASAKGEAPVYCIDPDSVFGRQMDFDFPAVFFKNDSFEIDPKIAGKNKTPCGMGYFKLTIAPDTAAQYCSMTGHLTDYKKIDKSAAMLFRDGFFEEKEKENDDLINDIASSVKTESSSSHFNTYCAQNFIDNALRGGFPVNIGNDTYYAYSRVHGDMEREYNNFVVLSEYFSQGNGNYRDVNQNRRNDIFFNRNLGDDLIHFFMNLIQIDGFNPLVVLGVRFEFDNDEKRSKFLEEISHNVKFTDAEFKEKLNAFIKEPLTIGGLFNFIEDNGVEISSREELLSSLLKHSKKNSLAVHGEGYWSDHWHYNTDLIENYLAIFPDRFEQLLFGRKDYIYYDDCYFVEPRRIKYVLFRGKPAQIRAVRRDPEKTALISSRKKNPNAARTDYGKGYIYHTNLLAKLMCIIANKYASLDPECLGIEMESDKPNWCDALNGLPGLFGSSSAESLELLRLVSFLNRGLAGVAHNKEIMIEEGTAELLTELADITKSKMSDFDFWDRTHTAKEMFREKTRMGISGNERTFTAAKICELLSVFEKKLESCREKLESIAVNGIVPTCFGFIPEKYDIDEDAVARMTEAEKAREKIVLSALDNQAGATAAVMAMAGEKTVPIVIRSFKRKNLPLFLEGPVHYLRLCPEKSAAENFHRNMLLSPLYDKKLNMIKINAPIESAGQEIGRITIFTPGWLENESIWLHMEYKYMLEMLRNNLAEEFFSLANTALVPFFDPAVYGRSTFENSSFIASSAHPDESLQGQGFVARLTGATAEFISMWIAMTSGFKPFSMQDGELTLALQPCLPSGFFKEDKTFAFKFLSSCDVVYRNESRKNTYGSNAASVKSYRVTLNDGSYEEYSGKKIKGKTAHAIRDGKAKRIDVILG